MRSMAGRCSDHEIAALFEPNGNVSRPGQDETWTVPRVGSRMASMATAPQRRTATLATRREAASAIIKPFASRPASCGFRRSRLGMAAGFLQLPWPDSRRNTQPEQIRMPEACSRTSKSCRTHQARSAQQPASSTNPCFAFASRCVRVRPPQLAIKVQRSTGRPAASCSASADRGRRPDSPIPRDILRIMLH